MPRATPLLSPCAVSTKVPGGEPAGGDHDTRTTPSQLAAMHNALGVGAPVPAAASSFFDRPFRVIWGGQVAETIRAAISDPEVQRIAARRLIGGIDQWSDSTDLRADISRRAVLKSLYD